MHDLSDEVVQSTTMKRKAVRADPILHGPEVKCPKHELRPHSARGVKRKSGDVPFLTPDNGLQSHAKKLQHARDRSFILTNVHSDSSSLANAVIHDDDAGSAQRRAQGMKRSSSMSGVWTNSTDRFTRLRQRIIDKQLNS